MLRLLTPLLLLLLLATVSSTIDPTRDLLVAQLTPFLEKVGVQFNTSFSVGYFSKTSGPVGVTSTASTLNPSLSNVSLILMGSVTKSWTAAAIVQVRMDAREEKQDYPSVC